MGNSALKPNPDSSNTPTYSGDRFERSEAGALFEWRLPSIAVDERRRTSRRLVSTKELSEIWGVPESTLRYWRCAETGPPYVKLGGRIKYDLTDVEDYVRANKRMPSVRAHGG